MEENQINYAPVSVLSEEQKAVFYRKTYSHLAGALLAFIVVEYFLLQVPFIVELTVRATQGFWWLLMIGGFAFITNYAERMALSNTYEPNKQYIAMFIYILAEAIIFVPLIFIVMYYAKDGGINMLSQAFILTAALFSGITAVAFLSKRDFSFLRGVLTISTFVALGLIVAGMIFGFNLGLWFSAGMVVIAAISILYQTSQMIHKYQENQYVAASLGLLGSFLLLFWYILSIFSRD
jgi:FtsH-binding integral membrane protein